MNVCETNQQKLESDKEGKSGCPVEIQGVCKVLITGVIALLAVAYTMN